MHDRETEKERRTRIVERETERKRERRGRGRRRRERERERVGGGTVTPIRSLLRHCLCVNKIRAVIAFFSCVLHSSVRYSILLLLRKRQVRKQQHKQKQRHEASGRVLICSVKVTHIFYVFNFESTNIYQIYYHINIEFCLWLFVNSIHRS